MKMGAEMAAKRDVRIVAWVLTILMVGMGIRGLFRWFDEPIVSVNYVDKLNELRLPAGYGDTKNGSRILAKASMLMDCRLVGGGTSPSRFYAADERLRFTLRPGIWPGDANEADKANVRAWLADNEHAFRMAEYAMSKEYCQFEISARDSDLGQIRLRVDIGGVDALMGGLLWRAKMKAADGDSAGAVRDVLLVSSMSRCFIQYPSPLERSIGKEAVEGSCWASLQIAARAKLTDAQLKELAAAVESDGRAYYSMGTSLEYERFKIHDVVQRIFSDDVHGNGRLIAGHTYRDNVPIRWRYRRALMAEAVSEAYVTEDRKTTLARWDNAIDKAIRLSEVPLWELKGKYATEMDSLEIDLNDNYLLRHCGESLKRMVYEPQKTRNIVEGTLTTLAVLRYKAVNGRLPDGLDDLVNAGLLKEMPIDRFTGKPFVYEPTPEDFRLYSAGGPPRYYGDPKDGRIRFWPPRRQSYNGVVPGDPSDALRIMGEIMAEERPDDPNVE
jgi:hypothetical protein